MGSKYPIWYRQPFKGAYVVSRFTALLVLIPAWATYYSITKPRSSWTLKESVFIRIIRWFMPLNANCGLHPLSVDKTVEVPDSKLKETSFVWIEPADSDIIRGYAVDEKVKPVRIPGYVWPKGAKLDESEGLVGLFVHGGGYMMGNGQESFGELEIVRQLQRTSKIKHFLSVDYRLVHESSHPGQLIDAISGYQHLLKANIDPSRIVVIGACAGGHLALMLTRYLYDHKLPMPIGMMVFSPMVDMTIDFVIKEDPSAKRPNTDIDLLATSHYACLRFLGDNPLSLLSTPLMSPNLAPKGTFNNYPKTFISVGDCDAFRRECEQLYDVLHTDGVDVTLDMQKDAVHDFWGMGDLVPSAKARRQLAVASAEWVGQVFQGMPLFQGAAKHCNVICKFSFPGSQYINRKATCLKAHTFRLYKPQATPSNQMPYLTVRPGLTYFYTDNGTPTTPNYKTMIIFHGHTFHSGTFQKLNPVATSKGLRLICINRREYPGTTPFTQEEIKSLNEGSGTERASMIAQQGADYALFVNGIIKECSSPNEGSVILTAWSVGNVFLLSLLASITSLPSETRDRLSKHVSGVIMWDPPTEAIGAKNPEGWYNPLWDEGLSPEARGLAFGAWVASYWQHGDLSTRDTRQFQYREPGTSRTATTLAMSSEEIASMTDFNVGRKWETALLEPYYNELLMRQAKKALFDPSIKSAWNNVPVWHMYGNANTWSIIYSAWVLEGWVEEEKSNETLIHFKLVEGANHFLMWDEPKKAIDCLEQCIGF